MNPMIQESLKRFITLLFRVSSGFSRKLFLGFELIVGDFHSHVFGESVKRNDLMLSKKSDLARFRERVTGRNV